ncbi:unnamed protein product [Prunus armeniaca]
MILSLLADSQKASNHAKLATQARAFISTTKGSTFYTSSQKPAWIIDSGATDHITIDPGQLILRQPST